MLTIRGNAVRYVNYTQCGNARPAVEKNGPISTSELEALLAKLDFQELKKLNLNSCNLCVDGCDDWIYFDNGTETHYIRLRQMIQKFSPLRILSIS